MIKNMGIILGILIAAYYYFKRYFRKFVKAANNAQDENLNGN